MPKTLKKLNTEEKKEASIVYQLPPVIETKDRKFNFRTNEVLFAKFNVINRKLGKTNGAVLNEFMKKYVEEHEDLWKL